MDPKNANNQSSTNAGANRQALFTPGAEGNNSANPVTPQPVGAAGFPPNQYFSNQPIETGDIIIGSGSTKPEQNKRPFIIGGVIFAVLAVVIVVFVGFGAGNIQKRFEVYWNEVVNGPEGADHDRDKWFVLSLDSSTLSQKAKDEYINNLLDTWQKVTKSKQNSKELKEYVSTYTPLLSVVATSLNFNNMDATIIQTVAKEGEEAARTLVTKSLPETTNIAGIVSQLLRQYWSVKIEVYGIYHRNGCITSNYAIDAECVVGLSETNPTLVDKANTTTAIYSELLENRPLLYSNFESNTLQLKTLIEGN